MHPEAFAAKISEGDPVTAALATSELCGCSVQLNRCRLPFFGSSDQRKRSHDRVLIAAFVLERWIVSGSLRYEQEGAKRVVDIHAPAVLIDIGSAEYADRDQRCRMWTRFAVGKPEVIGSFP
jgi:hypothetical protein